MKTGFKILIVAFLLSFVCMQQKIEVVTFAQLQNHIEDKKSDTLYVVNFWATWCKPCVQEMPFFEEAAKNFATQKVKVIYVSLNSAKELAGVEKFIQSKNIQNKVLLLNATNPNDWIDNVDASWSGSIPATVMYKNGEKIFFKEGGFTQEELNSSITKKINPIIIEK
jgi:thiol-disulfide isomerase/thioredoxin